MINTPDILKKILLRKHEEIKKRSQIVSLSQIMRRAEDAESPRGFVASIEKKINADQTAVIAEI